MPIFSVDFINDSPLSSTTIPKDDHIFPIGAVAPVNAFSHKIYMFRIRTTHITDIRVLHLLACACRDWRSESKLLQFSRPNLSVGFYGVG